MKERPILFSGEMVRAIQDGRKTQTRRIVKPDPYANGHKVFEGYNPASGMAKFVSDNIYYFKCPYGQPGDRLWVRETWWYGDIVIKAAYDDKVENVVLYKADGEKNPVVDKWHPSIHMFREYSRINLEITNIRVERLQDISGMDAKREGISIPAHLPHDGADLDYARKEFIKLWNKINGPASWDKNLFVWVVEFRRVS